MQEGKCPQWGNSVCTGRIIASALGMPLAKLARRKPVRDSAVHAVYPAFTKVSARQKKSFPAHWTSTARQGSLRSVDKRFPHKPLSCVDRYVLGAALVSPHLGAYGLTRLSYGFGYSPL